MLATGGSLVEAMSLRWFGLFMLMLSLGWGVTEARAQSSQQIQQVMSMSPAERQRLMRQFGVSEQDVMRMLGEQRSAIGASGQASPRSSRPSDMGQQGFEHDSHGDFFGGMQPGLMQPEARMPQDEYDDGDLSGRVDYSRRHGLEVFSRSFMPYQELFSIPVPDDYTIGPGDVFQVSLFGTESNQYYLPVQRDGWIDFPALGPIAVSGMSFADARKVVADRVAREKLGVRTSITLEQLKSIQLAVSGEVNRPGVYVVPSLVSVIQLLNLAGGATDVGALRRVRLLRAGERLDIDLYDFIISGERSDVIGLKPGDRLHLPAVAAAVHVKGAVRRSGVYEILPGETLEHLINMAGGLAPDAALGEAVLRRYAEDGEQQIVDVDLRAGDGRRQALSDGMILRVPRASEFTATRVEVKGEVTVPGVRQWREGMRLSHLFRDLRRDLNVGRADLDQGYIVRTDGETRELSFLSFSLRKMFRQPGSEQDPLLQQEDVVLVLPMPGVIEQDRERRQQEDEAEAESGDRETLTQARTVQRRGSAELFGGGADVQGYMGGGADAGGFAVAGALGNSLLETPRRQPAYRPLQVHLETDSARREREALGRAELLEPYLRRLTRQTRDGSPVAVFTVGGEVHAPGTYPITQKQSLRDAIEAAGGLLESADISNAVVLRRAPEAAGLEVFTVDLEQVRDARDDHMLMPGDLLTIRRDPTLGNRVEVQIAGEVSSPGTYMLPAGSTMADLIDLAGGITQRGDLRAAVLSRARLREMEQELRTRYVAEIRKSLIDANVAGDRRAQVNPAVLDLLDQLEDAISEETDGRLQIDLPRLAAGDSSADLVLSDGDRLQIPSLTNAISVAGQVRAPGSFAYVPGMSVAAYLELAGGFAQYSDEKAIFVLRADGSVQPVDTGSSWSRFGRGNQQELLPGDRIVVPIEYGYINRWDLAMEVVQFVYQSGIGLAAVVAALR